MRDGKGDIFVGREELSYVAGFNIASCTVPHHCSNLKVIGAAPKQVLVTFYSVTLRYVAVLMNLH